MSSVEETELSEIVDLPLIGSAEQYLFSVEDNRERADKLKELSCSAFKLHSQNFIKFLWGGPYSPHKKCNLDVEQLTYP